MQLLNELAQPYHLTYTLSPFLINFLYSKSFLFCFLEFLFVKCYNNCFAFKITNNICPSHGTFNFLIHKTFFTPIWNKAFCRNIFIFWYSYMITNLIFWTFLITVVFIKSRFHFNISDMHCCIHLLCHLIYQYTHFWYCGHIIIHFVL